MTQGYRFQKHKVHVFFLSLFFWGESKKEMQMIRRENKISFDFGKEEEDGWVWAHIGSWASSNINSLVVGLLERR
jgi:hypothetical protein